MPRTLAQAQEWDEMVSTIELLSNACEMVQTAMDLTSEAGEYEYALKLEPTRDEIGAHVEDIETAILEYKSTVVPLYDTQPRCSNCEFGVPQVGAYQHQGLCNECGAYASR